MTTYHWRGDFLNEEVNRLHAQGFNHDVFDDDGGARSTSTASDGSARATRVSSVSSMLRGTD